MNGLVQYMLKQTQDQDEKVALEACEFWMALAEQCDCVRILRPFLGDLIPVLINGMKYSDNDIMALRGDEDDESVPDSEQDIRPRHVRSKMHGGGDMGDESDDEEDPMSDWNIRKCSAAALDQLSNVFRDEILPFVLPKLDQILSGVSHTFDFSKVNFTFRIGLRERVAFWFWAQFQMVVRMAWQSTCRE